MTAHQKRVNGFGTLRSVLEAACTKAGCGLGELTVLSAQVDPYRLDTASGHRDGQWVAEQLERLVKRSKKIHWRGLHYVIVVKGDIRKPNGEIYVNSNEDWEWLSSVAGKAARWLGYIPFERIGLAIEKSVLRHIGVKLTCHHFRHLAAKIILDANPGAYELARQLLGHKDLKTTTRFYAGIDTRRAGRAHADLLARLRDARPERMRRRSKASEEK
jgi:hypothetical protein